MEPEVCWWLTGKVHALVKDRHRSREFIEFLKLLDAAYPAGIAIKLILDSATSESPQNTSTRSASWPVSTTSSAIPSFTHGPTSSPRPLDRIRTTKTRY